MQCCLHVAFLDRLKPLNYAEFYGGPHLKNTFFVKRAVDY